MRPDLGRLDQRARFYRGMLAIAAIAMALWTLGCGGGGGVTRPADITGVWTGHVETTQTGDLEVEMMQVGTSVTGIARLTLAHGVYTGPVSGTLCGCRIEATAKLNSPYGTVSYDGTAESERIIGTFTHVTATGLERGSLRLTRGTQPTVNIAGEWLGTFQGTGLPGRLDATIVQNGNALSGTTTIQEGSSAPVTCTLCGVVIGDRITLGAATTDSVIYRFTATVSSGTIAGSYTNTGGGGTFSITRR